jgi:hypothetical protein
VAFHCVCLLGACLFALPPFSGAKSVIHQSSPLLSVCCDALLFVSQFCRGVWLWVLLTGSGDELCGLLLALLQAVAYHLPAVGLPTFPTFCLLIVHAEISSLPLPPFLMHFQHSHPFFCVLIFSLFFITQLFFCGVFSLPRVLCWFTPGVLG